MILYINDPYHIYFLGQYVVAGGAFSFISMPGRHYGILCALIFLPFIPIAIATKMVTNHLAVFLTYLSIAAEFVIIFEYARRNIIRFKREEFRARKSLEKVLGEKEEKLKATARELSRAQLQNFAYQQKEEAFQIARQMAHDIRSPLSSINLAAQKAKDYSSDLYEVLTVSTRRINEIAECVLKSAREKLSQERTANSARLIDTIKIIINEKTAAHSQSIILQNDLNEDIHVQLRESDLARIMANLIQNSIEASGADGRIEIRVSQGQKPGFVEVTVSDNGQGIPAHILPTLGIYGFSYGKANGSGLGLSHARRVIESVNGNLSIESKEGEFTTVKLTLPVSQEPSEDLK